MAVKLDDDTREAIAFARRVAGRLVSQGIVLKASSQDEEAFEAVAAAGVLLALSCLITAICAEAGAGL